MTNFDNMDEKELHQKFTQRLIWCIQKTRSNCQESMFNTFGDETIAEEMANDYLDNHWITSAKHLETLQGKLDNGGVIWSYAVLNSLLKMCDTNAQIASVFMTMHTSNSFFPNSPSLQDMVKITHPANQKKGI